MYRLSVSINGDGFNDAPAIKKSDIGVAQWALQALKLPKRLLTWSLLMMPSILLLMLLNGIVALIERYIIYLFLLYVTAKCESGIVYRKQYSARKDRFLNEFLQL